MNIVLFLLPSIFIFLPFVGNFDASYRNSSIMIFNEISVQEPRYLHGRYRINKFIKGDNMRQYHKILKAIDIYSYRRFLEQMFIMVGLLLFSLVSGSALAALANPFATPDNFDAASCPIGHKKYTIANTASTAPSLSSWESGEELRTFTFNESSGNKTFTISFPLLIDTNNSNGTVPFYGSINDATSDAINLVHNSTRVQTDHSLELSVNRPVSKIGYKIQDLDSTTTGFFFRRTPYIEQVDVSANNGRLTFNDIFHNINEERNIVKAKEGENCSTGQCTIDATWGYKPADSVVNLKHSNEKRETSGSHATGYSDFYFCLAPPKVLVKKVLAGNRVNDSDTNRDQFELSINRGTTVVNTVTTTGSGSAVTNNNNRNAISIAENTSYTITEKVRNGANGTTLGEIANYNASYTCTNATKGSTTVMPTADMTYNAANKTRSFTLSNAAFGDEITCTITNNPASYTFSGTVFDDNGGIAASEANRQNISTLFTGNKQYFNGKLDAGELGIYENGLRVKLTDCDGRTLDNKSVDILSSGSDIGKYSITVSGNKLVDGTGNNLTKICLVEEEPQSWGYSVDTTTNTREITLVPGVYNYANLNFGEVEPYNTALVLIKSQHIHNCDENFTYPTNVGNADDLEIGFGEQAANNVIPGKCIAYRVTAYNRGHVELENIQIKDTLQTEPVASTFHFPLPVGNPASINPYNNSLPKDTITSKPFNLLGVQSSTNVPQATLYFNTKYGSTISN